MNAGKKIIIDSKEYIFLCRSEDLKEGKSIRVQVGNEFEEQVALFRFNGRIFCLTNICPHRHRDSMHRGFIFDGKITCPEHGWTYDLETGKNVDHCQGLKSLKSFKILEKNGLIITTSLEFELPKWKNYNRMSNGIDINKRKI